MKYNIKVSLKSMVVDLKCWQELESCGELMKHRSLGSGLRVFKI